MSETSSPATVSAAAAAPSVRLERNVLLAAKGGGTAFAGRLFQYGNRFILGILLARLLGAEQMGLCSLALTIAYIAGGLVLLGLPASMVRYVSLFAGRRDTARLWGVIQIGLGLTAVVGLLIGIGLFALADSVAEQVFHESRLTPLLRVISLAVPFLALNNVLAAITRGFKKIQYSVIGLNISQPAIRLILVVVMAIILGLNATRALVTFTVSVMIAFAILLYLLNKLFSLKRPPRTTWRDIKRVLRFALPVYLSSLISIFGGNIKTMVLGALSSAINVGVFTAATQINTVGIMFHGSIVAASAPIVSELYDRGELKQMGSFYQTVTKWTFTLNLPLFLIVLLFPVPILSIFGQSFVDGAKALSILSWANMVNTGTGIGGTILDMTGRTSMKLINSLVTFALTLGLNILLIPAWGLTGAAVASLTATTVINLLCMLEVFILFRLLPYNSGFIKPLAAGLVALAVSWGVRLFSPPKMNLVYIAMNVAILLAVYGGMILLLGLSREDRTVLTRVSRRMSAVLPK